MWFLKHNLVDLYKSLLLLITGINVFIIIIIEEVLKRF